MTGSGKTRVYLELVASQLQQGRSAVVLIPEIALTPQIIALFEASFPGLVVPYHSGLTEAQRHQSWQRALESQQPLVVVGPRSALFLPLKTLGLIVVDECHETSYKQEQNPRYHAVPTAAKLASLAGAKLVLGSATPGLGEVYLAQAGRIKLVKLTQRIGGKPLPPATIIDLRDKPAGKTSQLIAQPLVQALTTTLERGRQSLLFINRRGSASSHLCSDCGQVSMCPHCALPLTFHADQAKLICHLCNYRSTPPAVCPNCGSSGLRFVGAGTKRVEAELDRLFPAARILRLDKDSANPRTLPQLYQQLHKGEFDLLVGTQMIAKGWDLPGLETVGVVNADTVLHMPDFSAAERTLQLLSQVAGRAGRSGSAAHIFIQTYTPEHPAIVAAARGDFWGWAERELAERQLLGYPPFRYLLKITLSHKTQDSAIRLATQLYDKLKSQQQLAILGPAPAFHERAGGTYHWQLVAKSARRSHLLELARSLPPKYKSDIDPINLL